MTFRRPELLRRSAAIGALGLLTAFGVLAIVDALRQPVSVLLVVAAIATVPIALWYAVSRAGAKGRFAAVGAVVAFLAAPISVIVTSRWHVIVGACLLVTASMLGTYALRKSAGVNSREGARAPVAPATRPCLIVNPKSGGAKAQRFHLDEECTRRGIETITLHPGDDIRNVAEHAIEKGADVIGVAGGDGTLAIVASVASAHGIPFVVVPAGTFNHFALDLGLDRNDVVGSLDAFGESVERRVDLGEVNGRPFVNNVSLGLYASIVRLPEYRSAKIDTTLKHLPRLLGPESHPFDLRFVGARGEPWEAAHVVQVSNDPYGAHLLDVNTRPRLDAGQLGIISLRMPERTSERQFLRALASGRPERYEGFNAWTTSSFEVTSGSALSVGLDGEALDLEPPLRFQSRPRVLRVRLPRHAVGYSPAARIERLTQAIPDLWSVAFHGAVSADRTEL